MLRRTFAILAAATLLTAGVFAQQAKPEPAVQGAKPPAAAVRVEPPGQPVNVKLELTITDQSGPGEPGKRTVSMIVADRRMGSVRSSGSVVIAGNRINVSLNVDAEPVIGPDNRIRLQLALEYAPKPGTENATSGEGRAHLSERLGLIVEPGKAMLISQASDPTSDRKISVELLATVLR